MPGLAQELLMLAEEARTRRISPPPEPEKRPGRGRWVLLGAALGALATYMISALSD